VLGGVGGVSRVRCVRRRRRPREGLAVGAAAGCTAAALVTGLAAAAITGLSARKRLARVRVGFVRGLVAAYTRDSESEGSFQEPKQHVEV
jgi:hypothetical protein